MNMLQIHQQAIESGESLFHEFLYRYSKLAKRIYVFVEGREDSHYYRGAIENKISQEWEVDLWVADNKQNVIRIYGKFDWGRFSRKQILFFIDRDLSDYLNESIPNEINIYVTDMYAIENNIVNRTTCDRVLSEVCNLSKLPKPERDFILDLFDSQLKVLTKRLTPVMAWVIQWRRKKLKPNLDDIHLKHLFYLQRGRIKCLSKPKGHASIIRYIHAQCDVAYKPIGGIRATIRDLRREKNDCKFTRGKYLLWFLVEFVLAIYTDISDFSNAIKSRPKMHVALGHNNAMILIGPRARIPRSLDTFLANTCLSHINN